MAVEESAYQNIDHAIATAYCREQLITNEHVDKNDSLVNFGIQQDLLNIADSSNAGATIIDHLNLDQKKAVYPKPIRLSYYKSDALLIILMVSQILTLYNLLCYISLRLNFAVVKQTIANGLNRNHTNENAWTIAEFVRFAVSHEELFAR